MQRSRPSPQPADLLKMIKCTSSRLLHSTLRPSWLLLRSSGCTFLGLAARSLLAQLILYSNSDIHSLPDFSQCQRNLWFYADHCDFVVSSKKKTVCIIAELISLFLIMYFSMLVGAIVWRIPMDLPVALHFGTVQERNCWGDFPCVWFSPRRGKVKRWGLSKADIRGVNSGAVSVAAAQPFLRDDEISGILWQKAGDFHSPWAHSTARAGVKLLSVLIYILITNCISV